MRTRLPALLLLGLIVATAAGAAVAEPPTVAAKIPAGPIGAQPCAGVEAFGFEWVTNYGTSTLVRIDPATNRVRGRPIRLGATPCGIAAGAGSIWIDGYGTNTVERVSPTRLSVVARIRVGTAPFDVAFARLGVGDERRDGTVSQIDPRTEPRRAPIRAGGGPAGLSVAAGSVWVGSNGDEYLRRIDPRTNRVTRIRIGPQAPAWLAATDDAVWVSNVPAGRSRASTRREPRRRHRARRLPARRRRDRPRRTRLDPEPGRQHGHADRPGDERGHRHVRSRDEPVRAQHRLRRRLGAELRRERRLAARPRSGYAAACSSSRRSTDAVAVSARRVSASDGSRVVSRWRPRPGRSSTRAARLRDPCTSRQSSIVSASETSVTASGVTIALVGSGQSRSASTVTGRTRAAKFVPQRAANRLGRASPVQVARRLALLDGGDRAVLRTVEVERAAAQEPEEQTDRQRDAGDETHALRQQEEEEGRDERRDEQDALARPATPRPRKSGESEAERRASPRTRGSRRAPPSSCGSSPSVSDPSVPANAQKRSLTITTPVARAIPPRRGSAGVGSARASTGGSGGVPSPRHDRHLRPPGKCRAAYGGEPGPTSARG